MDTPLTELRETELDDYLFDLQRNPTYGYGDGGVPDRTAFNYCHVLRMFLKHADVEWASDYDLPKIEPKTVDPSDMLTPADINALTDAARNLRDIALIELLADTGARRTLLLSLWVGDAGVGQRRVGVPAVPADDASVGRDDLRDTPAHVTLRAGVVPVVDAPAFRVADVVDTADDVARPGAGRARTPADLLDGEVGDTSWTEGFSAPIPYSTSPSALQSWQSSVALPVSSRRVSATLTICPSHSVQVPTNP